MKAADLPQYYNICQILEHNLAARADKTALYSAEGCMTFRQAVAQVNQVGHALKKLDVRFGDCVGILSPDRAEWVTAFFAIAKIGATALGMNTLLNGEEYNYILRDSRLRVLIVHQSLLGTIASIRDQHSTLEQVIVIGQAARAEDRSFADWIKNEPLTLQAEPTHRDDFCSLHYSSGTTGPPKGILHAHKDYPLIAQLVGVDLFGINESDRTFSAAKLFFVYGIGANLIFPWYVGASCVLYAGSSRQVAGVLQTIESFEPTIFVGVPTVYSAILALPEFHQRYDLSSLRMCLSAGEALPAPVWQAWKDGTGLEILDTIGCTESYHTFLANRPGTIRPGSSGKPLAGYEIRLVDDDGLDVSQGETGHLMVKGESVALFYLHQYEKSRETFRGEWLLTGDRYYVDEDGFYWHAGRGDDMFKVGGLWVSPIEIEHVLNTHEAVLECAVIGQRDHAGLVKPKAFVCLDHEHRATGELLAELLKLCVAKLAIHKRPRWVEFIDTLPRTATGKMQRFKLHDY
ncbi:MAG: benzoate-CoA ligase family protein [Gammaproteobacteria bacterium]|nr:benzoate-CoA ligase family protein [Gammaproteobacteria bacterium]